jgi:hypothetical protein
MTTFWKAIRLCFWDHHVPTFRSVATVRIILASQPGRVFPKNALCGGWRRGPWQSEGRRGLIHEGQGGDERRELCGKLNGSFLYYAKKAVKHTNAAEIEDFNTQGFWDRSGADTNGRRHRGGRQAMQAITPKDESVSSLNNQKF